MPLVVADRVRETTTTTGTGTITLAGAVTGFQSFSVIGNGNTTYYCIAGQNTSEWEVGVGTYTSAGTTLARTTVLASSNAGAAVNFSAGTKDVFVTYPASYSATTQSPVFVTPTLGTPVSGTLSNCTVDGTNSVGFRNIPQNAQTTNYTTVLADSGKHIYSASGTSAYTVTIPLASSVAYPIGTAITFVNLSVNPMSILVDATGGTDILYMSASGLTGTRTLSQYGTATAIKVSGLSSSGIWVISGTGLT
jgi:hypothetical protein